MPHSVLQGDSDILTDATLQAPKTENEETQTNARTMTEDIWRDEGISQSNNAVDQDMTMADLGAVDDIASDVKVELQPEVKLVDLFADDDSDDEFPSSNIKSQDLKISSSPEAPPSPV